MLSKTLVHILKTSDGPFSACRETCGFRPFAMWHDFRTLVLGLSRQTKEYTDNHST